MIQDASTLHEMYFRFGKEEYGFHRSTNICCFSKPILTSLQEGLGEEDEGEEEEETTEETEESHEEGESSSEEKSAPNMLHQVKKATPNMLHQIPKYKRSPLKSAPHFAMKYT